MRWLFLWRPPCVLRRVIVHFTHNENSLRAVLWQSRGPWLTFRDVVLIRPDLSEKPLDGDAVIHRDVVLFLQGL
jgi:hypothetical protein